ncbi:hypothetical protein TBLA_0B03090 [Henningerozyma blattae CBS 6284]|uniref:Uncharacterized protein n=1 Tax=Henningerozyma blattae (strain ATCC 34711 / CBS 6284 / DSM 70876 / NBRC 10599 / NRRL Y-10934 / UCD 77-7) TaxID=1071380 RepID=I2GYE8_HENB6|nr:hypothetical protein TBLA_0B03090 [Tetrapisispora blattae CBS 6284]CCH59150.1 hypothetical protein TBLA_0B03090 [Tetrapisispora blattae CBS 6284]
MEECKLNDYECLIQWNSVPDLLNLPKVPPSEIKRLIIYDFDNTLYASPKPNEQLSSPELIELLLNSRDKLKSGNWWSTLETLEYSFDRCSALCENPTSEISPYIFWNKLLLKSAQLAHKDPTTVSIILTGRKHDTFHKLFERLQYASFLKDDTTNAFIFNAVCLKKNCNMNTFDYKEKVITSLVESLNIKNNLNEITIYEDRKHHVRQFQAFLTKLSLKASHTVSSASWHGTVVPVAAKNFLLHYEDEIAIIEKMFDNHNKICIEQNLNDLPIFKLKWSGIKSGFFHGVHFTEEFIELDNKLFEKIKKYHPTQILNKYPMYIPITVPGNVLSGRICAQIISNGDPKIIDDKTFCRNSINNMKFPKDSKRNNLLNFIFKITAISLNFESVGKIPSIVYKVIPVGESKGKFIGKKLEDLYLVGKTKAKDDELKEYWFCKTLATEPNLIKQSMNWIDVKDGPIIRTTFGSYSQLDYIKTPGYNFQSENSNVQ